MSIRISESWKKVLEKEFESDYFKEIVQKTKEEYLKFICYPPGAKIFRAFDECSFENLKVVIIGQDPYHGEKQANGLCFSVNDGIENPPSLNNIFKELKENYNIKIIDITKAFLESDLEEDIYIHKPPGYNIVNGLTDEGNHILKLNKAVYGLVQASKCFYRRINTFLSENLGFEISRVDPCLMRKVSKENYKKIHKKT